MQYLKSPNSKTYIQWNVESGSGFFTLVTQNDDLVPPSGSETLAGKFATINFYSGSTSSYPPVGQSIFQWENNSIKNPNFIAIEKEEFDTFLATACANIQTNWPV